MIIDAGIGQSSDASMAMELGCDGVLINTAIAKAKKPIMMAESMKHAVIAGRKSYLSGRIEKTIFGNSSSPNKGIIIFFNFFFYKIFFCIFFFFKFNFFSYYILYLLSIFHQEILKSEISFIIYNFFTFIFKFNKIIRDINFYHD